jgi:uncharacterized protein (DUF2236 family)
MEYFVDKQSVVREIWGKSDTILFIFAGASAEFALSKAVDWLYFTGRLPSDPVGRFLSTVSYAQTIAFSEKQSALCAIDNITGIHAAVEESRGTKIPNWAYRDVLSMLIDYSIRSFEMLQRKLTRAEKNEVFQVFSRMGTRMGVQGLPDNFEGWEKMRAEDMINNLEHSTFTTDLFRQYRKRLGLLNYLVLLEAQKLLLPERVRGLLGFRRFSWLSPLIAVYRLCVNIRIEWPVKVVFLFSKYKKEIGALNVR